MIEWLAGFKWSHIAIAGLSALATAGIPLVGLIILRALFDFHLAHWLVKKLSWIETTLHISPRSYSRERPHVIRGLWTQRWDSDSPNYALDESKESSIYIYQFNTYCYGEFLAKDSLYVFFGEIIDNHLWGRWYDSKNRIGYFGAHQLEIIDENRMSGRWIGHSKRVFGINEGAWEWVRPFPCCSDCGGKELRRLDAKGIKRRKKRKIFTN